MRTLRSRRAGPLALATVALLAGLAPVHRAAAQLTMAQSFTAPVGPNTQLLTIGATGLSSGFSTTYTASIFAFTPASGGDGTLTGPSLFSQALGPTFAGFSLAPNIALVGGASYALVVVAGANGNFQSSLDVAYAGGNVMFCSGTLCQAMNVSPTADLAGFALTFGPAATTVPEPATGALVALGVLTLAVLPRRRRTR